MKDTRTKKARLTSTKAKQMLKDKTAQGHPITKKQEHYFQAVAHGFTPTKKKRGIVSGVKSVAKKIKDNIDKGQKDLKEKNIPYYSSINPLKGTVDAFKEGYKAQRKLLRGMKGYKR